MLPALRDGTGRHPHFQDPHIPPDAPQSWPIECAIVGAACAAATVALMLTSLLTNEWVVIETNSFDEQLLSDLPFDVSYEVATLTEISPLRATVTFGPFRLCVGSLECSSISTSDVKNSWFHVVRALCIAVLISEGLTVAAAVTGVLLPGELVPEVTAVASLCAAAGFALELGLHFVSGVMLWQIARLVDSSGKVRSVATGYSYWISWAGFLCAVVAAVSICVYAALSRKASKYAQIALVRRRQFDALEVAMGRREGRTKELSQSRYGGDVGARGRSEDAGFEMGRSESPTRDWVGHRARHTDMDPVGPWRSRSRDGEVYARQRSVTPTMYGAAVSPMGGELSGGRGYDPDSPIYGQRRSPSAQYGRNLSPWQAPVYIPPGSGGSMGVGSPLTKALGPPLLCDRC